MMHGQQNITKHVGLAVRKCFNVNFNMLYV